MQAIYGASLRRPRPEGGGLLSTHTWWVAALVFGLGSIQPAIAQYGASLHGTVVDSQGAVVPGAQLTLTDKETNHALITTSNSTGDYSFNELSASTYTLV